ncbi:hypothetical protein F3Y22_tig00110387pilonHSYRG00469 [Hibiscus syriacus]|uniref:Uncharacterized protein n=2 Tax=Hibiscus syriacus TaxID=106335 RepID=A0A6A3AT62_HIBSY|nr:hypothetical protein F3Y22_tig00110387pilonHSYRG00469 [Hibiscus syriacus]
MSHIDLEQGTHRHNGSDVSVGEASVCFSDGYEGSCFFQFYSTAGGSHDGYSIAYGEIGGASDRRGCSTSDFSVEAEIQRGSRRSRCIQPKLRGIVGFTMWVWKVIAVNLGFLSNWLFL